MTVKYSRCLCRSGIMLAPEFDSKLLYYTIGVLGCFYGFKRQTYIKWDSFEANLYNIYQGGMI